MKRNKVVLLKIVKYCDDINFLIQKFNNDFANYINDISFQYSCNMCIIQIGELISRLSEDFRQQHKEIPWKAITGFRDVAAHKYEALNIKDVYYDRKIYSLLNQ